MKKCIEKIKNIRGKLTKNNKKAEQAHSFRQEKTDAPRILTWNIQR